MTQPAPAPTVMAAAAALRSGAVTSEALTLVALERIAATDANVQAWAHLDREHALALARAADALRGAGVDLGPLAGIGIGVKDLISTGDQPTQLGSPIFAGARPSFDAECIVRLKRAGGFVCALIAGCLAEGDFPRSTLTPLTRAPRLAWLADFPSVNVGPEQRAASEAAVDALRRDGASVTPIALPGRWHEAHFVHRCIMLHEGARELGPLQERERQRMSATLNAMLDEGRAISAATYVQALEQRDEAITAVSAWLAPYDAIVALPAPGAAPGDLTQTGDPSCCTLWSLLGFPAITIPAGLAPNGLPLGLQFAASQRQDDRLLAVAQWCEARLPFKGLV